MSSLFDAFAALIAHLNETESGLTQEYLAFPAFYYPLDASDLDLGQAKELEEFSLRVNMIPSGDPLFSVSDDFLWGIYARVLKDALISTKGPELNRHFVEARAKLGDGLATVFGGSDFIFFPAGIIPTDLRDTRVWTPVHLDQQMIGELAPRLGARDRDWLRRFHLLTDLGGEIVTRVSCELTPVVITRGWFDPEVLTWRFWDLPGKVLSDGNDPPRGELPGYITKLLLIRNLVIGIDLKPPSGSVPVSTLGTTIMMHAVTGPTAQQFERLAEFSHPPERPRSATFRVGEARAKFTTFHLDGVPAPELLDFKAVLAETLDPISPPGAPDGFVRFHVPLAYDTADALQQNAADLKVVQDERLQLEAQRNAIAGEVSELQQLIALGKTIRIFGPNDQVRDHRDLRSQLARQTQALNAINAQIAQHQAQEARLKEVGDSLRKLPTQNQNPDPYVLALVCERVPKSPNPDPALFS
jgi:uncharacterized coiled-coil protein SlyX